MAGKSTGSVWGARGQCGLAHMLSRWPRRGSPACVPTVAREELAHAPVAVAGMELACVRHDAPALAPSVGEKTKAFDDERKLDRTLVEPTLAAIVDLRLILSISPHTALFASRFLYWHHKNLPHPPIHL